MPRWLAPTLAALVVCLRATPAAADVQLEFRGNVLFNEFVYRSVLQLPSDAPANLDTARLVARKLARFLHDAGYVLATVRARVAQGRIRVDVEEGQLDKIIILGEGAFETLRLKFELSLPSNVFNRPLLEEQLKRLAARYQLQDFAYELVPVADPGTAIPQLDEVQALQALPFVKPGRPYELRIFVKPSAWGTGLSPDLYIGGADGLGVGAHYTGSHFFVPDDRYILGARVAGTIRQRINLAESRPVLSRARGEARWFSPALFGEVFRPTIGAAAELQSRQRGDLLLESYDQLTLEMSLGLADLAIPSFQFGFAAGIERRILFSIHGAAPAAPETVPPPLAPQVTAAPLAQTRPYLQGVIRTTLNPDEIRRDRRHAIDIDGRFYGSGGGDQSGQLRLLLSYQKMWTLGWHELWVNGRGTLLAGEVLYADEESIGEHLRGAFGGSDYARRLASVDLEYRYSLLRDILKIGIFHDAVAFGALDRTKADGGKEKLTGANAFGVGLHVLLLEEFQIDAYFGQGYTTDGRSDRGIAVAIRQAF